MGVLKRGSSGEIVRALQDVVDAGQDGTFGPATERALIAWQKANGFKADGIAGPDLQHEMGLSALITLEPGDRGELVKLLQDKLEIDTTGVFEARTSAAVRRYQKANGLDATGRADPATLAHMEFFHDDQDDEDHAAEPEAARRSQGGHGSAPAAPMRHAASGKLASWAYQLANIDPRQIAALPVDLVVVDYAREGDEGTEFDPADLVLMKQRTGGGTKKVIAYMSIGEAEDYRFYWQQAWGSAGGRPAWLDELNPDWEGNYKVRFWDPDWKSIILGRPGAYLDRIIAAGFDGVYLDIIDAFEYWRDEKAERPDADREMIEFVKEIAAYARKRRPDFLVVPQNGEALLEDAGYRAVISAQAKEDLLFGLDGDGRANKKQEVAECLQCIVPAAAAGLPILVVEYLDDAKKRERARNMLAGHGFVGYFAPRDLAGIASDQFNP